MFTTAMHQIQGVELGPVQHFEKSDQCQEFWTRTLTVTMADDKRKIDLFSWTGPEALEIGGVP